ncbi:MAG: c-type cytochrome [Chloroflexi bacterium]|nr:c-type cytochrome [Chloroflexota bacterium]
MRQLTLAPAVVLALAISLGACGASGQAAPGLRDPRPAPDVAGLRTPQASFIAHPLPDQLTPAPNVPGDPNAGRTLFIQKGCGGCHTLTGVPGATGVAGPRLDNTVLRGTIAGNDIPASPANLARWIQDPAALKPSAAMPPTGVTDTEARDLAAFLYSLPETTH